MTSSQQHSPVRVHGLSPYLSTDDPAAAIAFYTEAFGAVLTGEPYVGEDGQIGHAELRIGEAVIMLAGEHPPEDVRSPKTLGGTTVQLVLQVPDADAVVDRATAAGASVLRPVERQFYGSRAGKIRDPFGHNWFVEEPPQTG
jgi:PhnB protein